MEHHGHSIDHIKAKGLKIFLIVSILMIGLFGVFNYVKSNTEIFIVKVEILESNNIKPDDSVVLSFSNPVNIPKTEGVLKIEPSADFNLKWSDDGRRVEIIPKRHWKIGEKHEILINNGSNYFGAKFDANVPFVVESLPKIISISPTKGEKNVMVDIEDPIYMNFDKSIEDYNVKIIFNPMAELSYDLGEHKKSIKIMPKSNLEQGRRYDIFVEVKHKKGIENEFERIFDSYFETRMIEWKDWSKDASVRLFEARNYTQPKIVEGKYIDINLKSQVMVIFENGEPVDSYLVSSGKAGMNTPEGSFQTYNKHPRPWSKKYSLFMPYWMAITPSGEYGIHELPEWPGGYKEGANHLGIPVSHGCVRLGVGAAERVYNWADVGTPVIIHY